MPRNEGKSPRGGGRPDLAFLPAVGSFLADLMALRGLREAELDLRIACAASL